MLNPLISFSVFRSSLRRTSPRCCSKVTDDGGGSLAIRFLLAEQVAMSSPSPGKARLSPLLCDETRTLLISCLRKICGVIEKNQRRIDERRRVTEEETKIVSTNTRDLFTRVRQRIPFLHPSPSTAKNNQLKPLLSTEIVEQLTAMKEKFSELFRVSRTGETRKTSVFIERSRSNRVHSIPGKIHPSIKPSRVRRS